MEVRTLSMCRICLAVDVRMHTIKDSHLQNMYEHLSLRPLKTQDKRPTQACYICFSRLKNCHLLRESCVRSEQLLTEMMSGGVMTPAKLRELPSVNKLAIVHPVMRLSVEDTFEQNTECNVLRETCGIYFDVKVEPADTEDRDPLEEAYAAPACDVPSDATWSVPLDRVKKELPLFEANIKIEISEEAVLEDHTKSSDLEDDVSLEAVKRELANDNTGLLGSTRLPTPRQNSGNTASRKIKSLNNKMISAPSTSNIYYSNNSFVNVDHKSSNRTSPNDEYECNTAQKYLQAKTKKKVICTSAGERPFQCDVCKMCFKRKDNLEGHLRTHAATKPYQCNVCDKSFVRKYGFENHIRLHTGEKPYQCDICKKCFRIKSTLDGHISTHTGEKPFKCIICQKGFNYKSTLVKHVRKHTGERSYECTLCKKRFYSKGDLTIHTRVHTGKKQKKIEKPNKCNVCMKSYKLRSNLDNHICSQTSNSQTLNRPFQCNVCEKTFTLDINLNNHMRIHTGEKPYQCEVCNKCFSQKGILNNHIRTHSDVKPFQCGVCNKCFRRKGNLESHIRVHKGSKPFQCNVCNKCFGQQSILDSHKLSHSH